MVGAKVLVAGRLGRQRRRHRRALCCAPRTWRGHRSGARGGRRPRAGAGPRRGWRRPRRTRRAAARGCRVGRRCGRRRRAGGRPRSRGGGSDRERPRGRRCHPTARRTSCRSPAGVTSPACTAATPTAPAPSTYSLARSISITMASAMASSSTATISSTQCSTSGPVSSPRCLTAMPSASVTTGPEAGASPRYGEHTAACTPITRTAGSSDLTAIATPDARPPPPSGTTTQRQVGEVLDQLEPERALPGDHRRVVERVAERHAVLGRPSARRGEGLVQ